MTFRPTVMTYGLAVILAWIMCLGVALDRVELFFVALPLLIPILRSPVPPQADVAQVTLTIEPCPRVEGEELNFAVSALAPGANGPIEILPVVPPLLASLRGGETAMRDSSQGASVNWNCRLRCQASGAVDLGVVFFRLWDRSGLWVGESRFEQRTSILIYPRAEAVRSLPTPRRSGAVFGIHMSRNLGDGADFADIRPFTTGDRMKRINWPVSLRMRRLHVNKFHAERSAEILLLIDSFTNVGRRPDSSLDHTLRAAASLTVSYLRQHDRVGLMEFGGRIRWTRPAAGHRQYETILGALAKVSIDPTEFLQDLTMLSGAMMPHHALIIALTPLVDERFARAVGRLADQGRDVVVLAICSDEISEKLLSGRRTVRPLARRLWALEREDRLRELRAHGVRAVNWSPALPIEAALQAVRRPVMASGAAWCN
jgi:uncharacterized protein (DUF58 family)